MTARECLSHPWLQVTTNGSPIGQRRALTPPSPDTMPEEPLKKCRCDGALSSPSTSCSHNCESEPTEDIDSAGDNDQESDEEKSPPSTNGDQIGDSDHEQCIEDKESCTVQETTTTTTPIADLTSASGGSPDQ